MNVKASYSLLILIQPNQLPLRVEVEGACILKIICGSSVFIYDVDYYEINCRSFGCGKPLRAIINTVRSSFVLRVSRVGIVHGMNTVIVVNLNVIHETMYVIVYYLLLKSLFVWMKQAFVWSVKLHIIAVV